MTAKLYGLSLGPGGADLLTLKAHRILTTVPVVATPKATREGESLALEIARPFLQPGQRVLPLVMPMTGCREVREDAWARAAAAVAACLDRGEDVAFITLGDLFTYSTYGYFQAAFQEVRPQTVIENVPGVTSFAAAAARLGQPLAAGREKLALLPGVGSREELEAILNLFPNIIILKPSGNYALIYEVLTARGLEEKAVLVARCGWPDEEISAGLPPPGGRPTYLSLILIRQGG